MIKFSVNSIGLKQLYHYLLDNDMAFIPPFSSQVELKEYADKLYKHAIIYEAWEDKSLVGILAVYNNRETNKSYIPYFCVSKAGIGHSLFEYYLKNNENDVIELEVRKTNIHAISFYKRQGFYQVSGDRDKLYMRLEKTRNTILVSIACVTYNHEPYIRECIEGFLMQKTNFKYEILIHDDASTDGTADIIREYEARYPDIIRPIYQTVNQYSKGISPTAVYNLPRARGKYIALCEGDDYWTDSLKLQKQVDFLEMNQSYSSSFHLCDIINEKNEVLIEDYPQFYRSEGLITLETLIFGPSLPQTLSVIFRSSIISSLPLSYKITDIFLFYFLLKQGNAICLAENMGVYRNHPTGEWSKLSFTQKNLNTLRCRLNIYQTDKSKLSALFVILMLKSYPRSYFIKKIALTFRVCQIMCKYLGLKNTAVILFNKLMFNEFPSIASLRESVGV